MLSRVDCAVKGGCWRRSVEMRKLLRFMSMHYDHFVCRLISAHFFIEYYGVGDSVEISSSSDVRTLLGVQDDGSCFHSFQIIVCFT